MRGSRERKYRYLHRLGIIPAHAGLTCSHLTHGPSCRDHPRACGAHNTDTITNRPLQGSSPRMRGSHELVGPDAVTRGIIPAHAGLTTSATSFLCPIRDHPRACGAHHSTFSLCFNDMGSSPRMRGSRQLRAGGLVCDGIIPAHAGLTVSSNTNSNRRRDHPRACGAHYQATTGEKWYTGSSPRMRGSLSCIHIRKIIHGIIPAHAGLT